MRNSPPTDVTVRSLRRYGVFLLLAMLWGVSPAWAQRQSLELSSTTCPGSGCVALGVTNLGSASVQLVGTGSWTAVAEGSIDGTNFVTLSLTPAGGGASVTSATATGLWLANVGGMTQVRVRLSVYASGTVVATLQGAPSGGGGGGGAGSNVSIIQGANTAAVNASSQLSVTCANCSGSGVSQIDNTGFTPGTTLFVPLGGEVDDVATTAITENSAGAARLTVQRAVHANPRDNAGAEVFGTAAAAADNTANPTLGGLRGYVHVFDGSTWDRWTGAVAQSGTWNITNVSGTVSLPTGASTSAAQTTAQTSLTSIDASASRLISSAGSMAPAAPLATTSLVAGGVYNSTPPTFTNTQQGAVQLSSAGRLLVELPAGGSGLTNTELRASAVPISVASIPSHAVTNAGTFAVQSDSELPSAAALADNTANPTVPGVASFSMCWDGTNWDRCSGAAGTPDTELSAAAAAADAFANPTAGGVLGFNMCWNGTTWDRCAKSLVTETAHDTALGTITSVVGTSPVLRASAAAPANVSAGDDAVLPWALLNGSQVVNVAAGSTLLTATSTSLNVNCTGGCSGGTTDTDDASVAAGQTIGLSGALGMVFDGTVWRRTTIGVAGTASAQVTTVQGVASMTPILATLSGTNTVTTVSTVTNLSQLGGTAISMNTGVRDAGTQRVTIATNDVVPASQSGTWNIGTVTTLPALVAGTANIGDVDVLTVPAPLSTTGNGTAAAALRVSIASDSTGKISIWDGTDTLLVDGSGNLAVSCSNCTGSGVSAIDNSAFVGGSNTVASMGAVYDTTPPTITDGSVGAPRMDSTRYLYTVFPSAQAVTVSSGTVTAVTAITNALPAGTNNIGDVDVLTLPALVAGTANIGDVDVLTVPADPFGVNADAASATGSISAKLRFIAGTGIPITGTVTVGSHAVTNAGTFAAQPTSATSGGCIPNKLISAATTNATSVKASAGQVYTLHVVNINAAARYLKLYNKASAPTVGTDTPVQTFTIPANSTTGGGFVLPIPVGMEFTTGIAFALTTGVADADTGAVEASEITVNYCTK